MKRSEYVAWYRMFQRFFVVQLALLLVSLVLVLAQSTNLFSKIAAALCTAAGVFCFVILSVRTIRFDRQYPRCFSCKQRLYAVSAPIAIATGNCPRCCEKAFEPEASA